MSKLRRVTFSCWLISFLIPSWSVTATSSDAVIAEVEITASEIAFLPSTSHDFQSMSVRIVDPEDRLVLDTVSWGEGVVWTPAVDSPGGLYHYEATVILLNPEAIVTEEEVRGEGSWSRQEQVSGLFELLAGQILAELDSEVPSSEGGKGLEARRSSATVSAASEGTDTTETFWKDIAMIAYSPEFWMDDRDIEGIEWKLYVDYSAFHIFDDIYDQTPLLLMASENSGGAIKLESSGDLRLMNGSFFFDKSATNFGIGTATPQYSLSILDTLPVIHLVDSDSYSSEYTSTGINMRGGMNISGNSLKLFTRDSLGDRYWPLVIKGVPENYSLTVVSQSPDARIPGDGYVGIGTITPEARLHIKHDADKYLIPGWGGVLVEEVSGTTAVRTQFQLRNNGAPRFALENSKSGIEWSFQQSDPGNFLISKEGTGGPEMQVYQNGRVRIGPGGAKNFDLDPAGNLTIKGSLTANGSTFPDYVFETDYELMSLSDLRSYIHREKRLPDVPSAEEVQAQGGHNMTELQLKLLEKIEELTLYILEQDHRLEQRDAEIESLKRDNTQMKAENAQMNTRLSTIEATLSDR